MEGSRYHKTHSVSIIVMFKLFFLSLPFSRAKRRKRRHRHGGGGEKRGQNKRRHRKEDSEDDDVWHF